MERLIERGREAGPGNGVVPITSAAEAERMIEGLVKFQVEDVGSSTWLQQHDWIDKLNMQAHHNAQTHSDEFVLELLVSLGKLDTLVHNLLVIETWKEAVYPFLNHHIASNVDPIITYTLLFHEAVLANVLEVVLFREHACQAIDEDHLLELCDWGYRKLQYLNSQAYQHAAARERTAASMMAATAVDDLEEKKNELEFGTALAALTIVRYLADHCAALPMGLLGRLTRTNDTIMALVPLLDNPPWVRQSKGKLERFTNNCWKPLSAADRLQLCQHDIQVWLAVNDLLVDPRCRAKYELDSYRKTQLLKLKRFMNELLFDQVPVLKDLQRVLDEILMNIGPADTPSSGLILEQVPGIKAALTSGKDWRAMAQQQIRQQFGTGSKAAAAQRLAEMLQNLDFLCELQAPLEDSANAAAASASRLPKAVKVSCYRKATDKADSVFEGWCNYSLLVDVTKPPEPVSVEGADGACAVHGVRYRLLVEDTHASKPLPTTGKVVATYGGTMAEALLQLPVIPLRDDDGAPQSLWVTVGLLALDGIALQLKLKRSTKAAECQRVDGTWFAYHVAGGALTVRQESS